MKMNKSSILAVIIAFMILVCISNVGNAEVKKPIVIKLGHVGFAAVLGDDHAMALVFKETLEKMSGGDFQIKTKTKSFVRDY